MAFSPTPPTPVEVIPRPTPCPSKGLLTFSDDDEDEPAIHDILGLLFFSADLKGDAKAVKLVFLV